MDKSLPVTLLVRTAIAENWHTRNPTLQRGEWGLEYDPNDNSHLLLKIGNGEQDWDHLPYINKYDATYFAKQVEDGTITFSDSFKEVIAALQAAAGQAIENLQITEPPVDPYDVPNKQYVDDQIAAAGHLKRSIVLELPDPSLADQNTLYMILSSSGEYYEEYMVINGVWDMVGETGDGGSGGFTLEVATNARLGGVKSAPIDGNGNILTDNDYIVVNQNTGFMTLNQVSTSLLYVPAGDTLTLYGGGA